MALSPKQLRFCEEYVIDLNGTQSAIRAGYSAKTATAISHENLRKPNIQAYIQELQSNRQNRTEITGDMVIKELARIAFFDIRNIFNDNGTLRSVTELSDDTAAAISSIKSRIEKQGEDKDDWAEIKEYKANDKLRALEMLAKHLGILEKDKTPKEPQSGILSTDEISKAIADGLPD
jgi:phage terminase small subunit